MSFVFLCAQNILAMKRLDWKLKRIKFNSSHLNLPLGATMVFHFLYLLCPRSNPFSAGRGIKTRWELNIESNPLTCSPNQNLIYVLHQCGPVLKHSEFLGSLFRHIFNCALIFITNTSHAVLQN